MERINIEVPERWIALARSPIRTVITALTCLAISFAPVLLFMLGRERASYSDIRVLFCFAAIFLFPLIYIRLGALFITQLESPKDREHIAVKYHVGKRVAFWAILTLGAFLLFFLFKR